MYVVGLNTYGGPDVLRLMQLPDPHPGLGQVRIRVRAAGVNPVDVMVREGSYAQQFAQAQPPFVPGMDIAGTIDEVGEDIDPSCGITIGQDVVGVVDNYGSYGGYSQYVCLPAASVIPVPGGATFPAAASFLMNALTARSALDTLGLPPDSTLLVTGAAGAVGTYTVALAAAEGLRVVAIAAKEDARLLRSTGAIEIIERGHDVAARVRHAFPEGVDAVVDAALLYKQIAPTVRDNGTLIYLRQGNDTGLDRGIRAVFVRVRQRVTDHAAIVRLGQQASDGLLPMRVAATFPAVAAAAAHRRLAEGGLRGRIILDFDELHKH
ncbi:NADP-dependent oxidoreductase [Xylella taiwanensis]|uniref:NADP-dependent oxidoreductase n=1 Tax=Xylella taiwanensis TaxID=1444770 RepID=Z9JM15_9GAMM|nr:NADP-dependent oxidoreductase [Xylella taiwanensis]AXI83262.1 Zn-dependent oxidoreductase [Xylella taiwanensis]EWS79204.1 Zn-dependent oxidoreductase [Xylella taiwanensis]MCD8456327.1 NADP-dependent oxidoreductase [Xylella taiwanensis]MCD8458736.1 NADP-dependent oxidoreductase [Xylella taiwanensis]MCD8460870.1 NADP-dependent oxidoreductase [Xylella taiwanensis]